MNAAATNYVRYSDARPRIRCADLLLRRRWGLLSMVARGLWTHAATAAWWFPGFEPGDKAPLEHVLDAREINGRLMCLETRELHGGRAVTLSSQVDLYPGQIDVFEVNPENRWREFDRKKCVLHMMGVAGQPYGYFNIARAALLHLPFVRWFIPPDVDVKRRDDHPPFCSQARDEADQAGGVEPVPELATRLTEPSDLARSNFYRYRFTLIPDHLDPAEMAARAAERRFWC